MPFIDEGMPAEEADLPSPGVPNGSNRKQDRDGVPATPETDRGFPELLTPPGGPEPPGKSDLELPPIVPGELVPPPAAGEEGEKPPGQIQLPDSVQAKAKPVPSKLRIHPALSGGHRFDEEGPVEGMYLVINAVDNRGQTVDLDGFDIDAELSIVALDPTLDPAEARIGRWEFTRQEVKQLIHSDPTSGLHVPVRWQGIKPSSDDVIVHVRLTAEDEVMHCEARLKVGAAAAVARWTPRGEPR